MKSRGACEFVDGNSDAVVGYKTICKFNIAHLGWEMDSKGLIVEAIGGEDSLTVREIVLTNHGQPYFAHEKELEKKIREYEKLIYDTKVAIAICRETMKFNMERP